MQAKSSSNVAREDTYSLQGLFLLWESPKVQLLELVGKELLRRRHALSQDLQMIPELRCLTEILLCHSHLQLPMQHLGFKGNGMQGNRTPQIPL